MPQGYGFLSSGTLNPILCCTCQLYRCHIFHLSSTAVSRDSLNSFSAARGPSLYSLGADRAENTVSVDIAQQYVDCCLLIRCRGNLFIESLPSNERLLWIRSSGFQSSCHCITATVTSCVLTHVLPSSLAISPEDQDLEILHYAPALCWFLVVLFFGPEVGADMFLQNVACP
jgi:hypothetical protein